MVELGDLREGMSPAELLEASDAPSTCQGLRLRGAGRQPALCQRGCRRPRRCASFDLAQAVESRHGIRLSHISGGNSSCLPLLAEGAAPVQINGLRIGYSVLLGRNGTDGSPLADLHQDAFTIEGELIEKKRKPSLPTGRPGSTRSQQAGVRRPGRAPARHRESRAARPRSAQPDPEGGRRRDRDGVQRPPDPRPDRRGAGRGRGQGRVPARLRLAGAGDHVALRGQAPRRAASPRPGRRRRICSRRPRCCRPWARRAFWRSCATWAWRWYPPISVRTKPPSLVRAGCAGADAGRDPGAGGRYPAVVLPALEGLAAAGGPLGLIWLDSRPCCELPGTDPETDVLRRALCGRRRRCRATGQCRDDRPVGIAASLG